MHVREHCDFQLFFGGEFNFFVFVQTELNQMTGLLVSDSSDRSKEKPGDQKV